jgi:hypothetical protein
VIKPIGVRYFAKRWYLYWIKDKVTIASFASEFEAYSARRFLLKSHGTLSKHDSPPV